MDREPAESGAMPPQLQNLDSDDSDDSDDSEVSDVSDGRKIARIASRQFGRVDRRALLAAGISSEALRHRVRVGRLIPERRGVYAVGFASAGGRERRATALLHVGPASLVSHLSAAADWRIRPHDPPVVDITTSRQLRPRDGIRIHTRAIDPAEIRRLDGIPLTSPVQTLFDLTSMLGDSALLRAANEAFVLELVDLFSLRETAAPQRVEVLPPADRCDRSRGEVDSVSTRGAAQCLSAGPSLSRLGVERPPPDWSGAKRPTCCGGDSG